MGSEQEGYTSSSGLMKLSFIFNVSGMIAFLGACASGFAGGASTDGAAACSVIGLLCLSAGVMLHFMLLYLPELNKNRGVTLASAILCMIAGFFIIVALAVWGTQCPNGQSGCRLGPGAANAATLGILGALFAIGGGIALVLEFTGKYTLTAPQDTTPPANQM